MFILQMYNVKKKTWVMIYFMIKKKDLVWFRGEMDIISIKSVSAQLDISIDDNNNVNLLNISFFPFKYKILISKCKFKSVYSLFTQRF